MSKLKGAFLAAGMLLGGFGLALAAGLYTNGLPTIGAVTNNGTASVAPNGVVTLINPTQAGIPYDTGLSNGANPQTTAVSPFQIAATLAGAAANTATSTVHAATLNTTAGMITTESLSTAAGSTYTFTLTNSLVTATSAPPQVYIDSKTNTQGQLQLTSVTNASGTSTWVFTNVGTAALNGTMMIAFHL